MGQSNLAVQTKVMEFLDEFTDIISGEIQYFNSLEFDEDDQIH